MKPSDATPNPLQFPMLYYNSVLMMRRNKRTKVETLWFAFLSCLGILHGLLTFIQFFHIDKIEDFAKNVESQGTFFQIMVKFVVPIVYKDEILRLVDMSKKFLSVDEYAVPAKAAVYKRAFKILVRCQLGYALWSQGIVFVSGLGMIFGKVTLTMGVWSWHEFECLYYVEMCIQIFMFVFVSIIVVSLDTLFFGLCGILTVQFKLLKYYMLNLSNEIVESEYEKQCAAKKRIDDKIKFFVDYHNFLLEFLGIFKRIYAMPILCQYINSVIMICVECYTFTHNKKNDAFLVRIIAIYFISVVQIGLYLLTAEITVSEMETLPRAVYSSKWYGSHSPQLKTSLMIISIKSQKREEFTMGHLANANAELMLKALKLSLSYMMMLNSLINK